MPEAVIKYKTKRTLEALKDLAKYLDFSVVTPNEIERINNINGVTILPADDSVNTSEMEAIFSGRNINSKTLRQNAWQRTK